MKRRTRTEKVRINRQMIQIFVKMNGPKECLLDVSMKDTVGGIVRKISNSACSHKQDVYMTCEGRVLRWNDELSCSGVRDGCTVSIMSKMHGGAKHRNKKNKVEKKPATIPHSQEPVRGQQEHDEEKIIESLLSHENAEDAVIRHFEETEETRKILANLAERNNSDMERWIQTYIELSGLDHEQKKTDVNGIRRAVEARRKGQVRQPTAAEEQYLAADEVQEARGWQDNFLRIREARGEESREQNSEWVPVLPNMEEAGGSHLQTTDRRNDG